jgi:hypothetical protein
LKTGQSLGSLAFDMLMKFAATTMMLMQAARADECCGESALWIPLAPDLMSTDDVERLRNRARSHVRADDAAVMRCRLATDCSLQ